MKLLADCPLGSGKADCTSFLIQDGKLYYGHYGEQFFDLETGETGEANLGADLDAANRLVDHRQASVVYAQDGLYYRGEINIRAGLKGNKIEMVTPQEIYFSASQSGGNQCLLMKLDLETGQAETLDSRPEAGSGGYFAWQHDHRIKSIKREVDRNEKTSGISFVGNDDGFCLFERLRQRNERSGRGNP